MSYKYLLIFILISLCLQRSNGFSQEIPSSEYMRYRISDDVDYLFAKPKPFDFLANFARDYAEFYDRAFRKENLPEIGLIAGSTALLIVYDQDLIDWSQDVGRDFGLGNGDNTTTMLSVAGFPVFRGPTDFASSLYFIGDGWLHFGTALSFLAGGFIMDDNRALQTASQLVEGIITTGVAVQVLKHITGRQSPFQATQPGGKWSFFPDQVQYHKHVSSYDAYPSGHIATAMLTVTVIEKNYPEYRLIKPVGYLLIGLLGFEMMNNGVHWASDYPLGIAMGYLFADIAVKHGRVVIDKKGREEKNQAAGGLQYMGMSPRVGSDGVFMLTVNFQMP